MRENLTPVQRETSWLIVLAIISFMIVSVYHSIKQTVLLKDIKAQLVKQSLNIASYDNTDHAGKK